MKSSTRLDSAIFQLTPTRTRCDLVITANGKTEKIATGLLNPFLAHLKTAQEQIAKGGYSVALEPEPGSDRTWFTKGTVERFVRFVSTPEILERVYTIESEILQIEEAIAIQGNNHMGLSTGGEYQEKPVVSSEDSKTVVDANEEKAIVIYKPDSHPSEANGSLTKQENSKVQLLKVLETRKTVLQKEQGMAFARAAAAGFDVDLMALLVSFAECFGASRMMDACLKFMDLWKRKPETGQWVEIKAAEAISGRSDFSAMNASGILLSSMTNKQNESHAGLVSEDNGQTGINAGAEERHPMEHPVGQQEYFQCQFPHPVYPPWPIHSPPDALPVFQPYPVQGLPYYQNYPGNGSFYPLPYPPADESRFNGGHRAGHKRQSMDSRDGNTESKAWQMNPNKTRPQDDLELENESSKKAGRSAKRKSGTVVVRNINYIASKGQNSSCSESPSASDSEMDKEMKQKNYTLSKIKGRDAKSMDESNLCNKEGTNYGKETEGGHWLAFQNFLLKDTDERRHAADQGMFDSEKNVQIRRRKNTVGDDSLADLRHSAEVQDGKMTELHTASGSMTRMLRTSNDAVLTFRGEGHYGDGHDQMDVQFTERNGRKVAYRRKSNDDFMVVGRETQLNSTISTDPLAVNGFRHATNNLDKNSPQDMTDESFILPVRPMSLDQVGNGNGTAIDMDSELLQITGSSSTWIGNQVNYEPDELSLIPERWTETCNFGYDPALDYEMQVHVGDACAVDNRNKEEVTDVKQGSKKSEKDRKSKVTPDSLDKKKTVGPIRERKPSKLSPLDDARVRAERLRTYKADLQKMKKEKEEEDQKRLEALKMERQKRIASRACSTAAQSPSSRKSKKQLPLKHSLSSVRGLKFSDSEPGSPSPLQRSRIRTASLGSNEFQKASKISKSSNGSQVPGNKMTRPVSSLPESRKESSNATPEPKISMVRIRRLSEPKTMRDFYVAPVKNPGAELVSKRKVSTEPEREKISAIINLDRSKAATLPQLKIRTSKASSDVNQNKSAPEEMTQKVNGIRFSLTSSSVELSRDNDKHTHQNVVDDNPFIDKTIVMLECEKPSSPVVHSSEKNTGVPNEFCGNHDKVEKNDMISEYAAIHAPASPMDGVIETVESQIQEQPRFHTVTFAEKEPQNSSSICASGKPYQASFARLSSLEPCSENSENDKAPSTRLAMVTIGVETAKGQVSGFEHLKLAMIPESMAKVQVKESPKGFRRLLKFGKKNHSSAAGKHGIEVDNGSDIGSELDSNATNAASSSEVHTLKNLISQDEVPTTESTFQKSSRHFSLLSPFHTKTYEKKLTS